MAEVPAGRSTLASGAEDEDGPADEEPPFASVLPVELSPTWPSPRRAVLGENGGPIAWIEYVAARAFLGGVARIPRAIQSPFLSVFARLAKAVDRRRSEAARVFLRQALGAEPPGRSSNGACSTPGSTSSVRTLDAEISISASTSGGSKHSCSSSPRREEGPRVEERLILATPHLGDWESSSAAMAWIGFDPFYAVAKPPKNRWPQSTCTASASSAASGSSRAAEREGRAATSAAAA
jgi:hypothetical protein